MDNKHGRGPAKGKRVTFDLGHPSSHVDVESEVLALTRVGSQSTSTLEAQRSAEQALPGPVAATKALGERASEEITLDCGKKQKLDINKQKAKKCKALAAEQEKELEIINAFSEDSTIIPKATCMTKHEHDKLQHKNMQAKSLTNRKIQRNSQAEHV